MSNLREIAESKDICIPGKPTLKRYGLTEDDWLLQLEGQFWRCGVCGQEAGVRPRTGKRHYNTDHEHVRGWKAMPPELRKQYVRGLVCWTCNKYYLGRGITLVKAAGVVEFLRRYEARRPRES